MKSILKYAVAINVFLGCFTLSAEEPCTPNWDPMSWHAFDLEDQDAIDLAWQWFPDADEGWLI